MDFFFEPNGVAVVGATPETYSGGRYLIANLTLGYQGPIYPVNPKYHEVLGLKCYPSIREIDGPLDLALDPETGREGLGPPWYRRVGSRCGGRAWPRARRPPPRRSASHRAGARAPPARAWGGCAA